MSLLALVNTLQRGNHAAADSTADVRVRAFESLLFERLQITRFTEDDVREKTSPLRPPAVEDPEERLWKEDTAIPRIHLQGNGRYSVMVTNAGGGYSRWNEFDVTRWRSDPARDAWGSFLYIRDTQSDSVWAAAFQPCGGQLGTSSVSFSADRAEFHRRVQGIESMLSVTVAAEDDVEVRRLTLTNRTLSTRQLELTTYSELAMAVHRTDSSHPAFAKLFIQTEHAGNGVLIARRRLRSPDEPPIWVAHVLVGADGATQFETDRAAFLGRSATAESPEALHRDPNGSTGTVLDPILSLRHRLTLDPRERVEIDFLTVAAPSRESLLSLIAKYQRTESVTRVFEMSWTKAQLELRYLGVGPAAVHRFQQLASHLLYPNYRLRPPGDRLVQNRLGQSSLWASGISGDLPILIVTVAESRHLPLVREILLARAYWRLRGLQADVIILNQEAPGYDRPLHQQLTRQIEAHAPASDLDKPGGIFLRDWNLIPTDHRTLLLATASVVLHGGRGSLQQQLLTGADLPHHRHSPPRVSARNHPHSLCRFSSCRTSTDSAGLNLTPASTRSTCAPEATHLRRGPT